MPPIKDFRVLPHFGADKVVASGTKVGRRTYWKLYAIENFYRVLLHSILSVQLGSNWWALAVDQTIRDRATDFRSRYNSRPWHTGQGQHDIYYTDLRDLNEIARANSNVLQPVVKDIDQWLAKVEGVRLPRNVVAHMNYPSETDVRRIDTLYDDFSTLVSHVQRTNPSIVLQAP